MTERVVAVSLLAFVSCKHPPGVTVAPPTPAAVPSPPSQVLDALGAGDRTWAYVDGRRLREVMLPDLLHAAGAQRADLEVGLAALAATCGFQPLLSIEEIFATMWWGPSERTPGWGTVLRAQQPLDRNLSCLRALAPEAQETWLNGRRA